VSLLCWSPQDDDGFGMVVGSLLPTADNKKFLAERHRNLMSRPVDAEVGRGRLPAVVTVSASI
jgi:hypothetical protein